MGNNSLSIDVLGPLINGALLILVSFSSHEEY